jgi:hypothetical protein
MRRSQQVMRLFCGYVTASCFYAYAYVVQKSALTAIVDQAHNSKLEATPARTHGQAAVWVAAMSDRFYTPTLIRLDNEREGWVISHKLNRFLGRLQTSGAAL